MSAGSWEAEEKEMEGNSEPSKGHETGMSGIAKLLRNDWADIESAGP